MKNRNMRNPVVVTLLLGLLCSLSTLSPQVFATEILWSQYCQHLGKMKLLVHVDSDPTAPAKGKAETMKLWLRENASADWELADSRPIDRLTACLLYTSPSPRDRG